jgi:CHAT domain-containing protein
MRRDRCDGRCGLAAESWLTGLVHALLFELRGAAFAPAEAREDRAALDEALSAIAGAVLWPLLEGEPVPDALAVLPVGPLARLPWAALPLPDGRALCEAASIVVVPGLRVGVAAERAASRAAGPPLVVAADAGELAQVEQETRAILKVYPGAVVLAGAEATAERLLALAPAAGWIHFAGHGHYRADAPHESGLQLADRWLLAGELADLKLSARWVTLSACQSARALVQPGEEWFGLGRAFLLAGAGAVLASNWDIADGAAACLMETVYLNLGAGAPLSAALARAQSARRAAGVHPLDWAGFTVLGGPGTLYDVIEKRPVPPGHSV